jgi:cob(I)alamin adenosyltransferase
MSTKIYTKTGDNGHTGLLGGKRVAKSDPRIEAIGNVDELNAWLGLLADLFSALPDGTGPAVLLRRLQEKLFTSGSLLACEPGKDLRMSLPELVVEDVRRLESAIDEMDARLPPLKNFILPGGHPLVSQIHIARSVCRKAERSVVLLEQLEPGVPPLILQFLNRLSDYLFVLARATGQQLKVEEIAWKP